MEKTDSLGRATFAHIRPAEGVRPTAREVRWLKHLERHGPLSSVHLYELTRETHTCRDTALRSLQRLRAGGFLSLPSQQRATERAECRPYIYDLSTKAHRFFAAAGLAEPTVRPQGHWWHAHLVSRLTSSFDIEATRLGHRYIPAHEILARRGTPLSIPIRGERIIPDQLFALDYGGSYRAFALEVDRGTEPLVSIAARKNCQRSAELYRDVIVSDAHRAHYGLKSPLLVLYVFTCQRRAEHFLDLLGRIAPEATASILVAAVDPERLAGGLLPLLPLPWRRAGHRPVRLDLP